MTVLIRGGNKKARRQERVFLRPTDFLYTVKAGMEIINDNTQPIPPHAKKVFTGKIFSVWHWEQELFDGSVTTFERLSRPDYASAIGVFPNKRILLIKDEQPDRGPVTTPAGGKVDEGETPAEAAARELREETGFSASELVLWHTYRPQKSIQMYCHTFIARNITPAGEPTPEAGEKITLLPLTFEEFLALGHSDELRDYRLRLDLLEALLDPQKRAHLEHLLYGP